MKTKLSRLCEGLIEAGWLAALIVVPLFFNVHSSRVFEPDKISLLRSLALIMSVAWIIRFINDGLRREEPAPSDGSATASPANRWWQALRETPLVLPTLVLVAAYLLSTLLSVSPRISWWGSYQRLQGTYTTLSYIVIFFMMLGHLRRREQWERIVYAMILTSLPISIYGVLQKIGGDPLPWGGDVQRRIAANMGNAIFVAAYLIMVHFLTVQRLLAHFGRLFREEENSAGVADAVVAGCYLFITVLQLLAILFTQSRGPVLGLAAGWYVFALVGLLGVRTAVNANDRIQGAWRGILRWAWLATVPLAVLGVAFLIVFNLSNSPLAPLRDNPIIGRLGTAFDLESRTARVRTLIWEGVTELVPPHEPLAYPATDGQEPITAMTPDPINGLRPLVGYGPESMWVAYNRFYPPDLAHYENRNASPDRSHNETFDSLVITGLVGFVAYMAFFLSVFYYSLKWLGLIRGPGQRNWFLVLALVFGAIGALIPYLVQGSWVLSGILLPGGMIVGIILYITVAAVRNEGQGLAMQLGARELILMVILATVVAHFMEIHFGIAIASTRTYFWIWCAVLVVTGLAWLQLEPTAAPAVASSAGSAPGPAEASRSKRARRSRRRQPAPAVQAATPARPASPWLEVIILAVLLGIILFTLAYDFTINSNVPELRASSPLTIFWNAFTTRVDGGMRVPSLGVFWMVVFTWAVGTTIAVAYPVASKRVVFSGGWLARAALLSAGISGGIFLVFGLIHAVGIAGDGSVERAGVPLGREQFLDRVSGALAANITTYYVLLFLLVVALGLLLWRTRPGGPSWLGRRGWLSLLAGGVFAVAALAMIVRVNLSLVQADIIYKVGQAYDTAGQYENAIYLYEKAIDRQPREDYYYLFLGRSQLELARQSEGATRERYLRDAEQSLLRAQALNPLNTDHTANLGRLYLTWAQLVPAEERQQFLQKSLDYYQTATSLSPNAAHLHNEYGAAYQLAGDLDQALAKLQVSLALDSRYVDTYRRLSDLYDEAGQYELAIQALQQALELRPKDYQSHSALGYLYAQLGDLDKAIAENLVVLELRPNDLASHRNLAILYQETGNLQAALSYAQQALTLARNDADRADLEAFILELQQSLQG